MTLTDFTQKLDYKQVLTNPILDTAARFWDSERYEAFKICYKSMRFVDDLVDNLKAGGNKIAEADKQQLKNLVDEWFKAINSWMPRNSAQKRLIETMDKFKIPSWPWQKLSEAMIFDLNNKGFDTYKTFLKYSEGAAVAPGSVFMHLCAVHKNNGDYNRPDFDVKEAAYPLAVFCYIVHIIRDFQKDQNENLNYFAADLLAENNLNESMLKKIAAGGKIGAGFRNLMKKYYGFSEDYRNKARQALDKIKDFLNPRYRLSLEIIYNLYLQVFELINVESSSFTAAELSPSAKEVKNRINLTISSFEATL